MRHVGRVRGSTLLAAVSATALLAAGCGSGGSGGDSTLSFANSYTTDHPHTRCGIEEVAGKINNQDLGINIETFPNSQLGADDKRFASVMSGDVDMDVQGSSALSSSYKPIGVLDMAYAFDGPDELFEFFDSKASDQLKREFRQKTGARILGVWYFGMRHFTANKPIRSPQDLNGLRMRFPDSPTYLQNAKAMGAKATPVAFEEVYISLQQGVIDGQENPVPTIAEKSLQEVQSHVSMSGHQTGSQMVVISEESWRELSERQQKELRTAVAETQRKNRRCIEESTNEILDKWRNSGAMKIVDDVDRAAFKQRAQRYFLDHLEGKQLELYEKIRNFSAQ